MWYNALMKWLLKSSLHRFISGQIMSINYRGRRSGKHYSVPVNYHEDGKKLVVVSTKDRKWWRNMRSGLEATLQLRGAERNAFAEAVEDPREVEMHLRKFFKSAPRMARYFKVRIDESGDPIKEDISEAAHEHVVVLVELR